MIITKDKLKLVINNKESDAWCDLLNLYLPKYNIDNINRISAFIAQTGHESGDFRVLEENLNYSVAGLLKTFPKYFKTAAEAKRYAKQPKLIASRVYANRMGNGPEESFEGWFFRGKGLIQNTGKNNHMLFAKHAGKTLEETELYYKTKEGALHSACWFWSTNNCNKFADSKDIIRLTRVINGGSNGLADRIKRFQKCLEVFNA